MTLTETKTHRHRQRQIKRAYQTQYVLYLPKVWGSRIWNIILTVFLWWQRQRQRHNFMHFLRGDYFSGLNFFQGWIYEFRTVYLVKFPSLFFLSFVFLWLLLPIARVGWHVPACLVQFSRHGPPSLKTKLFVFVFCPILTMIRPYLSARCSIGVFVTTQDLKRIFSCLLQYHHWQSERRLHQDDGVENGVIWPRHSQSYQTRQLPD